MKSKSPTIKLTKNILPSHATHPGVLIADEIESREITQKQLADAMGIAPNIISEIIHGKRNLTPGVAVKMERAIDIDANYLMRLQMRYEIDEIRIKYKQTPLRNLLAKKTFSTPAFPRQRQHKN